MQLLDSAKALTGASSLSIGVKAGNIFTVTETTYTDNACLTASTIAPVVTTFTLNTCVLKDSSTSHWTYNTIQTGAYTAPVGMFSITTYQTAALCASSPTTAYTTATAVSPNTCVKG